MQRFRKVWLFIQEYVYSILYCLYLFTIGPLFSKNRSLINRISFCFGFSPKLVKPAIPKIAISKIFEVQRDVQVVEPAYTDGNISLLEIWVLNLFVKVLNPRSILEIGTFDGRTTLNLAINSSLESTVYTIDLPKSEVNFTRLPIAPGEESYIMKETIGARYVNKDSAVFPERDRIFQLRGDTANFDFSPYFSGIDMVFVDGSHSYEYVINDSKIALKLLRSGRGIIVWHDYDVWEGVTRALNLLHAQNPEFNMKWVDGTSLVYARFN